MRIVSALSLSFLCLIPRISSASLLAGFYDFTGVRNTGSPHPATVNFSPIHPRLAGNTRPADTDGYGADDVRPGFSGSVTASPGGSFVEGPGTYGTTGVPSPYDANGATSTGGSIILSPLVESKDASAATESNSATFLITNSSGMAYSLESLIFNIGSPGGPGASDFTYNVKQVGSAANLLPGDLPVDTGTPQQTDSGVSISLGGLTLANNQSISFQFFLTGSNAQYYDGGAVIDNIGVFGSLSAVPEISGVLTTGLLLGSGLCFRTRQGRKSMA